MKSFIKKLSAIFVVLAIVIAPLALVGCGEEATMSFSEFQDFQIAAAKSFRQGHTSFESFSDITYHWTQSSTVKENVTFDYNQVAEGDNYTTGTFEDKTVINADCSLAVKKAQDSLVAKLTRNTTVVETEHIVDDADNFQHKEVTTTTVTQEVYYVTQATLGTETLNVVSYYKSTKINDDDAVITKQYQEVDDVASLTTLIQGYALNYANTTIARNFFGYAELLMYPGYNAKLVKEGNRVTLSCSFVYAEINASLNSEKAENTFNIVFENGNVHKYNTTSKTTEENSSEDVSYAFDYVNSASIEALDLDGYTSASGIIYNYQNYCQSHIHA